MSWASEANEEGFILSCQSTACDCFQWEVKGGERERLPAFLLMHLLQL